MNEIFGIITLEKQQQKMFLCIKAKHSTHREEEKKYIYQKYKRHTVQPKMINV